MTAPAPTDAGALREALIAEAQKAAKHEASYRIETPHGTVRYEPGHPEKTLYGRLAAALARATTDADLAKAREEIAGLKATLKRIVDMEPATTEVTLAHEMAQEAREALTHGGDRGEN